MESMGNSVAVSVVGGAASAELPSHMFSAAQVRELDRIAIEECGIAGIVLMKRAGRALFELLSNKFAGLPITVFCGLGNNAGDGYIVAALAAQRRLPVSIVQLGDVARLQGDAKLAYEFALREGVEYRSFSDDMIVDEGVLVDALLGTGLTAGAGAKIESEVEVEVQVREPCARVIGWLNASGLPIVAADLPSGLCADSGSELGIAVRAAATVTFIGMKRGLLTGRGPALSGEVFYRDLEVPADLLGEVEGSVERLDLPSLLASLPARAADAHKGDFGHVMIIGGDSGFGGAPILAAEAAARMGAGLVSVATRPEHLAAILARRPEIMASGVTSGQELEPLLQRPTVLVVGPGLGQGAWGQQMLQQALDSGLPLVLDADALNLLAQGRIGGDLVRDNWVLTPHPGEAARLANVSVRQLQADRFGSAARLQQQYGGTLVLKGAGSLVASADGRLGLCSLGNPAMASGGMGDLLSGVIGALLAQGLPSSRATELAVCLHAATADLVVEERGARGLLATDLIDALPRLLNRLERGEV